MQKFKFIFLIIFCILFLSYVQAQQSYSTLIQSTNEDEIIIISVDKPVYYPGDTVRLILKRNNRNAIVVVTPVLLIDGTTLKLIDHNLYIAEIPQACAPGPRTDKQLCSC
jgi:hypothetical protein